MHKRPNLIFMTKCLNASVWKMFAWADEYTLSVFEISMNQPFLLGLPKRRAADSRDLLFHDLALF